MKNHGAWKTSFSENKFGKASFTAATMKIMTDEE